MYSLMSIRTSALSSSKRNSASAFESSVLPTPVGPRKRKEPIGRLGSAIPARERLMASPMRLTASVCPTTRSASTSSIRESFFASSSSMRTTGIPVQRETTEAMSSSVTSSLRSLRVRCSFLSFADFASRSFSSFGIEPYRISAAFVRSATASAESASSRKISSSFFISRISPTASFSFVHFVSSAEVRCFSSPISCSISRSRVLIFGLFSLTSSSFLRASRSISRRRTARSATTSSSGLFSREMRSADAASSMRSTALSGRNRSVI